MPPPLTMPPPLARLQLPLLALLLLGGAAVSSNHPRCYVNSWEGLPPEEGPPLLVRDSCGAGRWLVISRDTGDTECVLHCPNGYSSFGGRCRTTEDIEAMQCPRGMYHVVNLYGEAECQCHPRYVFHEASAECWVPYQQGPCSEGQSLQMITAPENGAVFNCAVNICEGPYRVPMTSSCEQVHPWSRHLHPTFSCSDPCFPSRLRLNEVAMEYQCSPPPFSTHMYSPPVPFGQGCPFGQEWAHGRCQKIIYNLPTQTRRNRPGGKRRRGFLG